MGGGVPADAAGGGPVPPSLKDRDVRIAAAMALALVLAAWWWSRGYNLADTVEYVRMAERLAAGERLPGGPRSVRPPAFALLLAPLFLVARGLEVEDLRAVMLVARGLQALLTVAAVVVALRLGARLAGRTAGFVAAAVAAASPALLRHGADPLPDVAAAVLVGLGAERLVAGERGVRAGLWLGAACLVSYKALPLAVALVLFTAVSDVRLRRARPAPTRTLTPLAGFAVALVVGGVLDRLALGGWWLSLRNYVAYNVAAVSYGLLARLGLREAAAAAQEALVAYYGRDVDVTADAVSRRIAGETSPAWYLANLGGFLAPPALLLTAVGAWSALRGRRRPWGVLLGAVLLYIGVLSFKHAKSMRLLLPALPLAAAFAAQGWVVLRAAPGRLQRPARVLAPALLAAALPFGWAGFLAAGPRRHGHYWSAVDWLERSPPATTRPERVAVADPFAIAYRTSPRFATVPLTVPDAWRRGEPGAEPTAALERALAGVDWMLVPEVYLDERFPVLAAAGASFRVEAAFFEPGNEPGLGALAVLRRADASASARRFVETHPAPPASPDGVTFERAADGRVERVTLLGVSTEDLPGSGASWTTWYWTTPTGLTSDLVVRVVRLGDAGPVEIRLHPGQGLLPPERWTPGSVVADARLDRAPAAGAEVVLAEVFAPAPEGNTPQRLRIVAGPTSLLGGTPAALVRRVEALR